MNTSLVTPIKLVLPENTDEVRRFLTFRDRSVEFQIRKLSKNFRFRNSDFEAYEERMNELKAQRDRCLLFTDEDGQAWTYAGLWKSVEDRFGWTPNLQFATPQPKTVPWATMPPEARSYQSEAVGALLTARHGGVSLPTGSGKSLILIMIAKALGLQTVIVTPSTAITNQLYADFLKFFGKKYVGKYGDGKKELNKLFTIAVAQSMVNVEKGTDAWDFFAKTQVFMFDECHVTPADTFESVAMGCLANAPYRFFTSATHVRADGSELLLKGITGPIVYSKSYQELVAAGFLSPMIFHIFNVPHFGRPNADDPKKETRAQLYKNPYVNSLAADIAFKAVTIAKRPTVIIVEEFKQFLQLRNFLKVQYKFVHGGVTGENKQIVPEEYWDVDNEAVIKEFNDGKIDLLIGTSAISTGVDLRPAACIIYLQGGISEVKVRQSIGRGTRLPPGKKDCWVVDFKVVGSNAMERHVKERMALYAEVGEVKQHERPT